MPNQLKNIASLGRYGDTMLAHINPQEAALLKSMGGAGTVNPQTGLPEFYGLGSFNLSQYASLFPEPDAPPVLAQVFQPNEFKEVAGQLQKVTIPQQGFGLGTRPAYETIDPELDKYANRDLTQFRTGAPIIGYTVPTDLTFQGKPLEAKYDPKGNFVHVQLAGGDVLIPDPNQPNIAASPKFNKSGGIVDYGVFDYNQQDSGGFGDFLGDIVSDFGPMILAGLGANLALGNLGTLGAAGASSGTGLSLGGSGLGLTAAPGAGLNLAATTGGGLGLGAGSAGAGLIGAGLGTTLAGINTGIGAGGGGIGTGFTTGGTGLTPGGGTGLTAGDAGFTTGVDATGGIAGGASSGTGLTAAPGTGLDLAANTGGGLGLTATPGTGLDLAAATGGGLGLTAGSAGANTIGAGLGNTLSAINTGIGSGLGSALGSAAGTGISSLLPKTPAELAALVSGAGNVASGVIGASAAEKAAEIQANAAIKAAQIQQEMFNTVNAQGAPYRASGYNALNQIGSMLPGQYSKYDASGKLIGTDTGTGYFTQQYGPEQFQKDIDPGYAFRLQQGQMANQRASNLAGGLIGGNALRGMQDYTQGMASQEYGNAFNRFQTQRGNIYNTLAGIAGIGQTAQGQANTLAQNNATAQGQLGVGSAAATAAGQIGQANAYGGALTGAGNAYLLSKLLGQNQGVAGNSSGSNFMNSYNAIG